ncbi:hypothetical protein TIFTF001_017377 [Ficus carica]|uniref:Uncharacterized protein n=1 Tax=Ficus carica TaxID=3494 RepID=A0AA88AAI7_FICCA|nr:hypothetical protein TIFTF001_017377 [Ficus carica]
MASPHVGTSSLSHHDLVAVDISGPSLSIAEPRGLVEETGVLPQPPYRSVGSGFFASATVTNSGGSPDLSVGFTSRPHLARPSTSPHPGCVWKLALLLAHRRALSHGRKSEFQISAMAAAKGLSPEKRSCLEKRGRLRGASLV